MRKPHPVVLCVLVLLGTRAARADDSLTSPAPVAQRPFGWSLEGGIGINAINGAIREGQNPGQPIDYGLGFGLQWTLRWKLLRIGLDGDIAMHIFAPGTVHAGLVAGVTWQATPVVRLDLLAEGGLSTYFNVGEDLFVTHVEGDRFAALPFAGVRAGLGWRFGPRKQGIFGLYLGFREDLMRKTLHPIVTSCLLGCSTVEETWKMGGESYYVLTRIGWEM